MLDLINNKVALRWAAAIAYGLVIANVTSIYHWQFYALLFLFWFMDRETYRQGVENGVCIGVKLPPSQRAKIEQVLDSEEKEDDE